MTWEVAMLWTWNRKTKFYMHNTSRKPIKRQQWPESPECVCMLQMAPRSARVVYYFCRSGKLNVSLIFGYTKVASNDREKTQSIKNIKTTKHRSFSSSRKWEDKALPSSNLTKLRKCRTKILFSPHKAALNCVITMQHE